MFDFDLDPGLLELLENKKVAIVGPSPHLIGTGLGRRIDQYDVVCRVNEIHPSGFEDSYGNKTDIMFHNCGTDFIDQLGEKIIESPEVSKQMKYVVCPCVKAKGSDNDWNSWGDEHISDVVANFGKVNEYNTPFYWIGMKNYRKAFNIFGCEPNAGQTAILLLLEHHVSELLITGFSFYSQGDHPSLAHRPGHTYKGREDEKIGNPGHPQKPQIYAFKNSIYQKYKDKIIVDSFLDNLLDLKHDKVL